VLLLPLHKVKQLFKLTTKTKLSNLSCFKEWLRCALNLNLTVYKIYSNNALNITAKWLEFFISIRDIHDSNLGSDTGYPDKGFLYVSSVLSNKSRDSILTQATTTSFHILSNRLFTNHPIIWRYIVWVSHSIVKCQEGKIVHFEAHWNSKGVLHAISRRALLY
jgi:hypothetical protein